MGYFLAIKVSTFSLISNIFFLLILDISTKEHMIKALALFWYHVCFSMTISS